LTLHSVQRTRSQQKDLQERCSWIKRLIISTFCQIWSGSCRVIAVRTIIVAFSDRLNGVTDSTVIYVMYKVTFFVPRSSPSILPFLWNHSLSHKKWKPPIRFLPFQNEFLVALSPYNHCSCNNNFIIRCRSKTVYIKAYSCTASETTYNIVSLSTEDRPSIVSNNGSLRGLPYELLTETRRSNVVF
jgi:hypothetical protein